MTFNTLSRASACLVALSMSNLAHAEDTATEAEPIIVVGQKEAPINIEPRGLAVSLGKEQFAGINAFNTEDLMKYAPNFFVRKRYAGDSNGVPGFRGTHSTQSARTLVMVDGFVVSNFLGNSFGFSPKWGLVGPGEVKQFDIVYGPYSSRYAGNSMGGIVNITTQDPEKTEAFVTVQGMLQPYKEFGTDARYSGYSAEAGFGLKQKDGPFSVRLTGRHFRNTGQPMTFYGLTPATGIGTVVTGAIIDPEQVRAATAGTGIAGSPGTVTNPIFAAQSPAQITQDQAKLKIGFNNGSVTGQALIAFWHNEDSQFAPDCYLRDAAGNTVCEGTVTTLGKTYTATGANLSKTLRDEYLAGIKLAVPIAGNWTGTLALSTYQIVRSDGFTSSSFASGWSNGAGTLARQGPTNWYTADLTVENRRDRNEFAVGFQANRYQTDLIRSAIPNWQSAAGGAFQTETFGKTRTVALWAEDRLKLGEGTITLGLRYENWRAFDGGLGRIGTGAQAGKQVFNRYSAKSEDALSPTLSGQVRLSDGTNLQLSLAMATRFPTVGELYQGSLNGDGTFNINSFDPNLKPERSTDLNLLVSHQFDGLRLVGSFFYQRVANTLFQFIGFNQNGISTSTFKNIDLTRQYGFELIAESRNLLIKGLDVDANVAWIDSRTIENPSNRAAEGIQFPRIPRWRINANARYAISEAVNASLGMRFATRPNTDLFGLQRGDTFGYTSELFALDAKINWQMPNGLRVSAGVDNITNDRAWVFHPYPQRTFLIEAGWKL